MKWHLYRLTNIGSSSEVLIKGNHFVKINVAKRKKNIFAEHSQRKMEMKSHILKIMCESGVERSYED